MYQQSSAHLVASVNRFVTVMGHSWLAV